MLAMFGKLKRFRLDIAREVREAVEGKSAARAFILDPPQPETKDDMKKKLWAWFAETEFERCKLFGMPVPEDTVEMAKKMGVPLELPVVAEECKKWGLKAAGGGSEGRKLARPPRKESAPRVVQASIQPGQNEAPKPTQWVFGASRNDAGGDVLSLCHASAQRVSG